MQTLLITGAASGIGLATAQRAASLNWRCVLVDRDALGLERLQASLPLSPLGPHQIHAMDLTDARAVQTLAQAVPQLDALINNAGMSSSSNLPLVEQSPVDLARLLQLNLQVPAVLVEALAGRMAHAARIVNVASGAGLRSIPWRGAYSPSKAGLIAQSLALAAARPDWCVTVLSPGFVRTALVAGLIQQGRLQPQAALAKIPLGRMAAPEELARALCFLASPDAAPWSGQVLVVDGGSSVYGGSQPLPLAEYLPCPLDARMALQVCGGAAQWAVLQTASADNGQYRACLDVSALQAPPGQVLAAVQAAAERFAGDRLHSASLTVLLPGLEATRWQEAGDSAAARMWVATLACEWGSRGLRINALEVARTTDPAALWPLLRFVCGPDAQYLTGQTMHYRRL